MIAFGKDSYGGTWFNGKCNCGPGKFLYSRPRPIATRQIHHGWRAVFARGFAVDFSPWLDYSFLVDPGCGALSPQARQKQRMSLLPGTAPEISIDTTESRRCLTIAFQHQPSSFFGSNGLTQVIEQTSHFELPNRFSKSRAEPSSGPSQGPLLFDKTHWSPFA